MPDLRLRRTDEALDALEAANWISAETRDELKSAYWFLRDVEHRIQMVHDEQSHTLPETDEGLERIARMMGEAGAEAFSARLVEVLRSVERHYAELFEQEARLSTETGNLVFTGEGDDPGHDRDARLPRLRAPRRHLPHDPHLALRPLPRHAFGGGARAADGTDAAPPARIRRHPPRRRGAAALRRLHLRPAGGHPAVLAAHHQSRRCSRFS